MDNSKKKKKKKKGRPGPLNQIFPLPPLDEVPSASELDARQAIMNAGHYGPGLGPGLQQGVKMNNSKKKKKKKGRDSLKRAQERDRERSPSFPDPNRPGEKGFVRELLEQLKNDRK